MKYEVKWYDRYNQEKGITEIEANGVNELLHKLEIIAFDHNCGTVYFFIQNVKSEEGQYPALFGSLDSLLKRGFHDEAIQDAEFVEYESVYGPEKLKVSDYCIVNFPFVAFCKPSRGNQTEYFPCKVVGYYNNGRVYKEQLVTTIRDIYSNAMFCCETKSTQSNSDWFSCYAKDVKNIEKYFKKATKQDIIDWVKRRGYEVKDSAISDSREYKLPLKKLPQDIVRKINEVIDDEQIDYFNAVDGIELSISNYDRLEEALYDKYKIDLGKYTVHDSTIKDASPEKIATVKAILEEFKKIATSEINAADIEKVKSATISSTGNGMELRITTQYVDKETALDYGDTEDVNATEGTWLSYDFKNNYWQYAFGIHTPYPTYKTLKQLCKEEHHTYNSTLASLEKKLLTIADSSVKDGKLVEPSKELINKVKQLLEKAGFNAEFKGFTGSGRAEFYIVSKEHSFTASDYDALVVLGNELDDVSEYCEKIKSPATFNISYNPSKHAITGYFHVDKTYVNDAKIKDEALETVLAKAGIKTSMEPIVNGKDVRLFAYTDSQARRWKEKLDKLGYNAKSSYEQGAYLVSFTIHDTKPKLDAKKIADIVAITKAIPTKDSGWYSMVDIKVNSADDITLPMIVKTVKDQVKGYVKTISNGTIGSQGTILRLQVFVKSGLQKQFEWMEMPLNFSPSYDAFAKLVDKYGSDGGKRQWFKLMSEIKAKVKSYCNKVLYEDKSLQTDSAISDAIYHKDVLHDASPDKKEKLMSFAKSIKGKKGTVVEEEDGILYIDISDDNIYMKTEQFLRSNGIKEKHHANSDDGDYEGDDVITYEIDLSQFK